MTHESAALRLSAYFDNELSPLDRAAVEAHLAQCPACSATLADFKALSQKLHQLPPPVLSRALLARLHIAADQTTRRPIERFVGLLSGVAACIAMMGGLLLLRPATAATLSPPDRWEGHAVGIIDESLISTGSNPREAAMGEWMLSNLSAKTDNHRGETQ